MRLESKTLLAVLMAAMMLGCAFVPLAVDTEGERTTNATTGEFDESKLAELFGAVKKGIDGFDAFEFGGFTLRPVANDDNETTQIPVNGNTVVGVETYYTGTLALKNSIEFGEGNSKGQLVISGDATLVLFPLNTTESYNFTAKDTMTGLHELVTIKPGAYLDIFGMKFQVVGDGNDVMDLFGIDKKTSEPGQCKVKYSNEAGDGLMGLQIDIMTKDTSVVFADMPFFGEPGSTALNITGTLTKYGNNGISLTDAIVMFTSYVEKNLDIGMGKTSRMEGVISGAFTIEKFQLSYDINQVTGDVSGKLNVKAGVDSKTQTIMVYVKFTELLKALMMMSDVSISTGDINFSTKTSEKTTTLTVSGSSGMELHLGNGLLFIGDPVTTSGYSVAITNNNLNVTLKDVALSETVDLTKGEVIEKHLTMSAGGSIEKGEVTINEKDANLNTQILFNNFSIDIGPITSDTVNGVTTTSVTEISHIGTVSGKAVNGRDISVEIKSTNIIMTEGDGQTKVGFDTLVNAKTTYDGKERTAKLAIEKCTYSKTSEGETMSVGTATMEKDIPNDIFEKRIQEELESLSVPNYFEIKGKGIVMKSTTEVSFDSFSAKAKNLLVFSEVGFEVTDAKVTLGTDPDTGDLEPKTVKCGLVECSYRNIGGKTEKFSITDSVELDLSDGIYIVKGNARFGGGLLPMDITVGKDAKFHADGLCVEKLTFMNGCKKSGNVVLRNMGEDFSSQIIVKSGNALLYDISIANNAGYSVRMDLSDLGSGTVDAVKGFVLPSKYDADGYSMTSSDGKTGKITLSSKVVKIDIPLTRDSFRLSYEGGFVATETYKFGDKVTIASDFPEKEGLGFLGWNDGTRGGNNLIQPGDEYIMPARDVTLRPVYEKEAIPQIVTVDDKEVAIIDGYGADVVKINNAVQGKWSSMIVLTDNATIEMDHKTYDKVSQQGRPIKVAVNMMEHFDNENIEKAVKDKTVYNVIIMRHGEVVTEYDKDTTFKVTVNMKTDGNAKDFRVSNFDARNGYSSDVGIDSIERLGDGSYDVTFTVNHFSLYAVEPVYQDGLQNAAILIALIIVIVAVCSIAAAYFGKKA